ncbi:hypothetical protein F5Y16DRAFT_222306 [Xylariaceae sp. FL0255]|nr:hypothetical protein F5Y16DRAFT_222306 [Xylariaceae sp. FL0255]
MSEYWKSTPKYWCKHCQIFVRDTKLERTNHEATGKHQSALKRFLRDLHRGHENEEREKERAKREIDRLNGVKSTFTPRPVASSSTSSSSQAATTAQRHKQWEQLAEMGIDVPTELRGDMAMAGEWTVTNTRVIKDVHDHANDDDADSKSESVATAARKRSKPEGEDEKDEEEEKKALEGLFKKPRKWGRDTNRSLQNEDDLDALLSTPLVKPPKKEEEDSKEVAKDEDPKIQTREEESTSVKTEEGDSILQSVPSAAPGKDAEPVKEEDAEPEAPAVVFKKRKAKNIRQK